MHQQCQRQYCNYNVINRDLKKQVEEESSTSRTLRSQESGFRFQEHCLFCCQPVCSTGKRRSFDVTNVCSQLKLSKSLKGCPKGCSRSSQRRSHGTSFPESGCIIRKKRWWTDYHCWEDDGLGTVLVQHSVRWMKEKSKNTSVTRF